MSIGNRQTSALWRRIYPQTAETEKAADGSYAGSLRAHA